MTHGTGSSWKQARAKELYFTGILYPNPPSAPGCGAADGSASKMQTSAWPAAERATPVPVKQKHYHHFGEQTHELTDLYLSFDGRPSQFGLAEFNTARCIAEALADLATLRSNWKRDLGRVPERYNDPVCTISAPDGDKDQRGLVEWGITGAAGLVVSSSTHLRPRRPRVAGV